MGVRDPTEAKQHMGRERLWGCAGKLHPKEARRQSGNSGNEVKDSWGSL